MSAIKWAFAVGALMIGASIMVPAQEDERLDYVRFYNIALNEDQIF